MKTEDVVKFIGTVVHRKMYDKSTGAYFLGQVNFGHGVICCKGGYGMLIEPRDISSLVENYKGGCNTPKLQLYLYGLKFIEKNGHN